MKLSDIITLHETHKTSSDLTAAEETIAHLIDCLGSNIVKLKDGKINIGRALWVQPQLNLIDNGKIKIPLGIIKGNFNITDGSIATFENFPVKITGDCHITTSDNLRSFDGCPEYIEGDFVMNCPSISSLHNLHKHLKHVTLINVDTDRIKDSILGLLLIDGFMGIYTIINLPFPVAGPFEILNRHAAKGLGKEALFACQQDMIDAGFEEYAQL